VEETESKQITLVEGKHGHHKMKDSNKMPQKPRKENYGQKARKHMFAF
jgi:hypothetical protein